MKFECLGCGELTIWEEGIMLQQTNLMNNISLNFYCKKCYKEFK